MRKKIELPEFIISWLGGKTRSGISDWIHLKGSVCQGTWLGPLLYILIDDFHPLCAVHKYMGDTTLTVEIERGAVVRCNSSCTPPPLGPPTKK